MARDGKEKRARERGVFERPKGSGVWWVRYTDENRILHREKVGPRALALKVYRKRKTEIAERRFFPERIRKREILLREAIDDYLKRVKGRARSYVNVKRNARYWKNALGTKTVRQITPGDIQRYSTRRLTEGMAAASVNRELTFLRAVFYMVQGDGEIDTVPFGKGTGKVKLYKENNRRVRDLSDKEEAALREKMPVSEWAKVAVALYTGLRQGNQFLIKWEDVNFETGTIRARQSKSGEDYHVPMNDELRRILRELPSRMRSPWVFPSDTEETALDAKNFVHRTFAPAVLAAEITDFHWHDLRHTFASRLVMRGVDLTTVQELMGHKTPAMTSRYAHLSPGHRLDAVQKLNPSTADGRATGTTTGTDSEASKRAATGTAQVADLPKEKNEPSGTRTQDPLLKRQTPRGLEGQCSIFLVPQPFSAPEPIRAVHGRSLVFAAVPVQNPVQRVERTCRCPMRWTGVSHRGRCCRSAASHRRPGAFLGRSVSARANLVRAHVPPPTREVHRALDRVPPPISGAIFYLRRPDRPAWLS